jgi:acetyltransferase-like isoleucine patch superfamily enzyme
MAIRIKKTFRNLFFYFFSRIIPELKLLRNKHIYWWYFETKITDSKVDKFTKLDPPFKISQTSISEGTYISPNSSISFTKIGKYCSIGPNFFCGWGIHPTFGLSTSPMFYSTGKQNGKTFSKEDKVEERKEINIGNDVFIGANVTVLDGVTIGDGAVIGAGAVVSKNIPPYAIALGCPIEIVKFRFPAEDIAKLLEIKWWDFNEDDLRNVEKYFFDVPAFLKKFYNC